MKKTGYILIILSFCYCKKESGEIESSVLPPLAETDLVGDTGLIWVAAYIETKYFAYNPINDWHLQDIDGYANTHDTFFFRLDGTYWCNLLIAQALRIPTDERFLPNNFNAIDSIHICPRGSWRPALEVKLLHISPDRKKKVISLKSTYYEPTLANWRRSLVELHSVD